MKIISMNVARHQDRSPLAEALKHIATRLRGEAQAEQQGDIPFLWFATDDDGRCGTGADRATAVADLGGVPEAVSRVFPLYTRPQPAAVSGDESAAFDAWFRGEQGTAYDGMWSFARAAWMHRAALSSTAAPDMPPPGKPFVGCQCPNCGEEFAASAAPAPVAGDAVDFDAIQHILKHALRNGVHGGYTAGFIESQIAALAQDRASKSGAAGVPEGWRPIETAPSGKLCVVGWLDAHDRETPERHDFDFIEEGRWARHDENVERAELCAPAGSGMPPREAPYQWFIAIPEMASAPTPAAEREVGDG